MTKIKNSCERCGQCCKQGGPALHHDDLGLVRTGKIPFSSLITIRKGELVDNPLIGSVQPVSVELVKISGSGNQWGCCYYSATQGCTIYEDRPQACRLLKCWDTDEILALIEKDTLSRTDILPQDHSLLPTIREHDRLFPCGELYRVYNERQKIPQEMKKELAAMVNDEMRFRLRIVAKFHLHVGEELFYFGRPLFQLLQGLGVRVSESASTEICLHWDR